MPATGVRDRVLVLALKLRFQRYFTDVASAGILNLPVVKRKNADTVLKKKEENKAVADVSFEKSRLGSTAPCVLLERGDSLAPFRANTKMRAMIVTKPLNR